MERECRCPDCGRTEWVEEFGSCICDGCGSEMDTLTSDRCNGCGRELWGRAEHEIGLCEGCQ